jgi:predicted AAA+ superfamily ATPase
MNIITGEELRFLKVPECLRRQLRELMAYLCEQAPARQSVCALYGLRRTGKTTLILRAIQELIGQCIRPETICYFNGQEGDTFDDLIIETEARKN